MQDAVAAAGGDDSDRNGCTVCGDGVDRMT